MPLPLPLPLPHPSKPLAAALAMLLGLGVAGCAGLRRDRLPVTLYVAVSVPEERVNNATLAIFRSRFTQLLIDFRRLHPNLLLQPSLYSEAQLMQQLRDRDDADLGPDLIITSDGQANALLRAGLVDPLPVDAELAVNVAPALFERLRDSRGRHAGLPMLQFPQLACYDRKALATPPSSLEELLAAAADGARVGLPLQLRGLLWTMGALGAAPALEAASQGREPTAEQRQAMVAWARWLQEANIQRSVSFYATQETVGDGLANGNLDWITCHSIDLLDLRRRLGQRLGVAPLPAGPQHPPSPANQMRVMALGRDSSRAQRSMALQLAHFSIQPLVQRSLTLETLSFLPVNPRVNVPVQSSTALAAMVQAERQALVLEKIHTTLQDDSPELKRVNDEVIVPLVFASLAPEEASRRLLTILRSSR